MERTLLTGLAVGLVGVTLWLLSSLVHGMVDAILAPLAALG